jgi:hypothetical protein
MGTDRRKQILFGALFVVLAVVVYTAVWTSPSLSPSSNQAGTPAPARGKPSGGVTAPEVHLDALNGERPKPVDRERNLFRFKPKPTPPLAGPGPSAPAPDAPAIPSGPPPPPPITLKFLGTVQKDGGKTTIAVLTDGQGPPMTGKEGDTIAGRYRILHIGVESIEMSYLDGRGRQTIRQTGS